MSVVWQCWKSVLRFVVFQPWHGCRPCRFHMHHQADIILKKSNLSLNMPTPTYNKLNSDRPVFTFEQHTIHSNISFSFLSSGLLSLDYSGLARHCFYWPSVTPIHQEVMTLGKYHSYFLTQLKTRRLKINFPEDNSENRLVFLIFQLL